MGISMGIFTYIIFLLVSFGASIAGAICGIGGGVIIKPSLDAVGVLDVTTISFLSGCTVLAMSCYSVIKGKKSGENLVDLKIGTPLGIGAAVGGVVGKLMFQTLSGMFENKDMVGAVQASCLLVITLGTLIYTLKKDKIHTKQIKNFAVCIVVGLLLGIMSSFLGIGGGPINLVVLFYFFSMETKTAAQNSLYIILFSQITSLLQTIFSGTIPQFPVMALIIMVVGGILGGFCGRIINKKMNSKMVDRLFIVLMAVIIGINCYNIYHFMN